MIGGVPHMNRWIDPQKLLVSVLLMYLIVFVHGNYKTIHFKRLMTLHHALLQESEIKMNNTPFGQLIIPSQAVLCVCPVITRGHLPMEQHWKTLIVSSCSIQKTTQFHQFHHVSKFHHPFLKTAWPLHGPNDPRFRPLSPRAPLGSWWPWVSPCRWTSCRSLRPSSPRRATWEIWRKVGRKNPPQSLGKCLSLRDFLPQIMRIICLTHCESWFSNVMIIYYDYCL